MRGFFRRANFLLPFSPVILVPVFVAGYFVLAQGDSFNAYRYEAAAADNPALPNTQGVYVDTSRGFLWLLPFVDLVAEPPSDLLPRVAADDADAVVIYRRALDPLERYKVFDLASGDEVAVERQRVDNDPALRLSPAGGKWHAASYAISVPQEGLAAGTDWYYFVVE